MAIGSFFARHFGWYNTYWYTDVILHTISGIWLGLLWLSMSTQTKKWLLVISTTSFATFGSVLWEFWEYAGYLLTRSSVPFYVPQLSDTLGDISCGMLGGCAVSLLIVAMLPKQVDTDTI